MTDCFALLGEARRPWLEPEALKQKFLTLAAAAHPDHARESDKNAAQDRCAELNAAYNRLRDPKERLQHLLELERGSRPGRLQSVPDQLMDLALQIGAVCRDTDAFLREKRAVHSPLLQVQLFERSQDSLERLKKLQAQLNSRLDDLMRQLKAMDADWRSEQPKIEKEQRTLGSDLQPGQQTRAAILQSLEELYRLFSFYMRWSAQVQERIVLLAL